MRPTVKSDAYPFFEPDQVLSADNLNQSFDYLDEQEQLTRANLIGIGIVCGLNITCIKGAEASITISKGLGVTSEGYLIVEPGDVTTVAYKKYTVPDDIAYAPFMQKSTDEKQPDTQYDLWELLAENKPDTTPLGKDAKFLENKAVMLFLELRKEGLRNCTPSNCDDIGTEVSSRVRRLLIDRGDLDKVIAACDVNSNYSGLSSADIAASIKKRLNLKDIRPPRYNVPVTHLVESGSVLKAFVTAIQELSGNTGGALSASYDAFQPVIADMFSSDPFGIFNDKIIGFEDILKTEKQVVFLEYYYDFASDIIHAYDELRWKGLELLCACNPPEELFPRHLMLGLLEPEVVPVPIVPVYPPGLLSPQDVPTISKITKAYRQPVLPSQDIVSSLKILPVPFKPLPGVVSPETYRQPFLPSPAASPCDKLRGDVRQLFRRLVEMIKSFEVELLEEVRITPSCYGKVPLSEKAIPCYYNEQGTPQLYTCWDPAKTRRKRANENLSYRSGEYKDNPPPFVAAPFKYDIEPYNFLRIEGHLGIDYQKVLARLDELKKANRLPFEFIALRTGYFNETVPLDLSRERCEFQDLAALYKTLREELLSNLCEGLILLYSVPFDAKTTAGSPQLALLKEYAPGYTYQAGTVGAWYETILDSIGILDKFELSGGDVALRQKRLNQFIDFFKIHGLSAELSPIGVLIYFVTRFAGTFPDNIFSLSSTDIGDRYQDIQDVVIFARILEQSGRFAALDKFIAGRYFTAKITPVKALYEEYLRRVREAKKKQFFSYFVKNNPGIQHGAGVPVGGTFVLVYHGTSDTGTAAPPAAAVERPAQPISIVTGFSPVFTHMVPMEIQPIKVAFTEAAGTPSAAQEVPQTPVVAVKAEMAAPVYVKVTQAGTAKTAASAGTGETLVAPQAAAAPLKMVQADVAETFVMGTPTGTGKTAAPTGTGEALVAPQAAAAPLKMVQADIPQEFVMGTPAGTVKTAAPTGTGETLIAGDSAPLNILSQNDYLALKNLAGGNIKLAGIIDRLAGFQLNPKEPVVGKVPDVFDLIEPGTVIADFFLPYICCSDCTPVQYVLPRPAIDVSLEFGCTGPGGADVKLASQAGIPPLAYKLDSQPFAALQGTILASPGPHTVVIRDSEGSESALKPFNVPESLTIGKEEYIEDLTNQTYQIKFAVSGGTAPYKAETGAVAPILAAGTKLAAARLAPTISRINPFIAGGSFADNVFTSDPIKYGQGIKVNVIDSIGCSAAKDFASPLRYALTIAVDPPDSGSVVRQPDGDTYSAGTTVTLDAQPGDGYVFKGWSGDVSGSASTVTIPMSSDKNAIAGFVLNTVTLTYIAEKGGTISGTSSQTIKYGDSGSRVVAKQDPGYQFTKWSDGKTTAARTDTNITADSSFTAYFEAASYTLTYTAGEGGKISGMSPQTVAYGGTGTRVTAVPGAGYLFAKWSDGKTTAARIDTNVVADGTFTAEFVLEKVFTLTVKIEGSGTVASNPTGGTYPAGTSVTLNATAAPGWTFSNWQGPVANLKSPQTTVVMSTNQVVVAFFTNVGTAPTPEVIMAAPAVTTRVAASTTPRVGRRVIA